LATFYHAASVLLRLTEEAPVHRSTLLTPNMPRALALAAVALPALASCLRCAAAAPAVGQSGANALQAIGTLPASPSFVDIPEEELVHRLPELKKLKPAASQDLLPLILRKVGANVAILFSSFPNVTCREEVTEQRVTAAGGNA
jgi:hypothetical protein